MVGSLVWSPVRFKSALLPASWLAGALSCIAAVGENCAFEPAALLGIACPDSLPPATPVLVARSLATELPSGMLELEFFFRTGAAILPEEPLTFEPFVAEDSLAFEPFVAEDSLAFEPFVAEDSVAFEPFVPDTSLSFEVLFPKGLLPSEASLTESFLDDPLASCVFTEDPVASGDPSATDELFVAWSSVVFLPSDPLVTLNLNLANFWVYRASSRLFCS